MFHNAKMNSIHSMNNYPHKKTNFPFYDDFQLIRTHQAPSANLVSTPFGTGNALIVVAVCPFFSSLYFVIFFLFNLLIFSPKDEASA